MYQRPDSTILSICDINIELQLDLLRVRDSEDDKFHANPLIFGEAVEQVRVNTTAVDSSIIMIVLFLERDSAFFIAIFPDSHVIPSSIATIVFVQEMIRATDHCEPGITRLITSTHPVGISRNFNVTEPDAISSTVLVDIQPWDARIEDALVGSNDDSIRTFAFHDGSTI